MPFVESLLILHNSPAIPHTKYVSSTYPCCLRVQFVDQRLSLSLQAYREGCDDGGNHALAPVNHCTICVYIGLCLAGGVVDVSSALIVVDVDVGVFRHEHPLIELQATKAAPTTREMRQNLHDGEEEKGPSG